MTKDKVLLYGYGNEFHLFEQRQKWAFSRLEILAIIDKNREYAEQPYYDAIRDEYINIVSPEKIDEYAYDYIIITTAKYYDEIKEELTDKGIKSNQILYGEDALLCIMLGGLPQKNFGGNGVDIGGPSEYVFSRIYELVKQCDIVCYSKNTVWGDLGREFFYNDKKLGKIIINDATALEDVSDEEYDYVLASNVLEHIANPLKAMKEWQRILNKDGILIVAVPDKQYTFDHERDITKFEHILEDYNNDIGEDDLSHLDDILSKHDLDMDPQAGTFEMFKNRSLKNFNNRCLHHHVFDDALLVDMANFLQFEILGHDIAYLNNWMIVLKKG